MCSTCADSSIPIFVRHTIDSIMSDNICYYFAIFAGKLCFDVHKLSLSGDFGNIPMCSSYKYYTIQISNVDTKNPSNCILTQPSLPTIQMSDGFEVNEV